MVGGCYIIIHGVVGELLKEDLYSAEGRQSINPSMNSVRKFSTLEITWQVDHTDPYHTALLRFNNLWAAEYAHNSLLVFSTGRSPHKYEELHQQVPLLTPSIGIFSVGTEILYGSSLEPDQGWVSLLDDGWDRDVALKELQRFTNLRMQDASEQRPHKISCQVDSKDAQDIMKKLSERLQDRGVLAPSTTVVLAGCS
jgi:sucrose-6F-phosphate phosphohydrolase